MSTSAHSAIQGPVAARDGEQLHSSPMTEPSEQLDEPRIIIRPFVDADASALAAAIDRSRVELTPWMPWVTPTYGPAEALGFIRRARQERGLQWVVIEQGRGPQAPFGGIVGGIGINQISEQNSSANLGYWVRSDCTGRGIATDAARRLARRAVMDLHIHRFQIMMSVKNLASRQVAEKLGATHE